MSINSIVHSIVRPSITALDITPGVGDLIDFSTPSGVVVRGDLAEVHGAQEASTDSIARLGGMAREK